jgi:hypothetical protein
MVSLIVAYAGSVVAVALATRELYPTLLAAAALLPLMFLLVVLLPTIVIAVAVGVTLGFIGGNRGSSVYVVGTVAGVVFAEIVLTCGLPLVANVDPDGFVYFATRPILTGLYGALLGLIAARLFRWFT